MTTSLLLLCQYWVGPSLPSELHRFNEVLDSSDMLVHVDMFFYPWWFPFPPHPRGALLGWDLVTVVMKGWTRHRCCMPSASSFVMCIHRCSFAYLKAAWPLSSDIIEVFSPADFLPQAVRCKTVLQENASGLEICVDEQVYLIKCHFVIIAALRAPRQRFLLLHSVNKVFQQSRIRWY